MLSRNQIIDAINHATQLLPQENEVVDVLGEVVRQLEEEWEGQFEDEL